MLALFCIEQNHSGFRRNWSRSSLGYCSSTFLSRSLFYEVLLPLQAVRLSQKDLGQLYLVIRKQGQLLSIGGIAALSEG